METQLDTLETHICTWAAGRTVRWLGVLGVVVSSGLTRVRIEVPILIGE